MSKSPKGPGEPHNPTLNPGDQARPGTPGIGENLCRDCKGSGRIGNRPCPTCGGTGIILEEIGGA